MGMCLCYVELKKKDLTTAFKSQIEHALKNEKRIVTKNKEENKPKMTNVAQVVGLRFSAFCFLYFPKFLLHTHIHTRLL